MKNKIFKALFFVCISQLSYAQCWKSISCGEQHCIGIQPDGTLWGWGGNTVGEIGFVGALGNKDTVTQIGTETNWDTISSGAYHTLALKTDGTLWATGFNAQGQVGTGSFGGETLNFSQIGVANDWVYISAGDYNSFAIKSNGTLWACGKNSENQLGIGNSLDQATMIQIGTNTNWKSIAAGSSHTLGIKTDGTLWSWGTNNSGETGIPSSSGTNTPTQVGTSNTWKEVSAGYEFSIGIKTDGTIYGWGSNTYGKAGLGNNSNADSPTQIATGLNWRTVNAGYNHSLALKSDNTLWAWGHNAYSQSSSDFGTSNVLTPSKIGFDSDWKNIATGIYSSHTVKTNGNMWSWGGESRGQLANGPVSGSTGIMVEVEVCTNNNLNELFEENIAIFPNPTFNSITITVKRPTLISIKTISGVLVLTKIVDDQQQIDLSEFNAGAYFISNNEGNTFKLIKK